ATIGNVLTTMAAAPVRVADARCPSDDTGWQATPLAAPRGGGSIDPMNENHDRVCPSPEWAEYLQSEVLPQVVDGVQLGATMLEIGPGPGASTDWLRHRVDHVIALELEEAAAAKL